MSDKTPDPAERPTRHRTLTEKGCEYTVEMLKTSLKRTFGELRKLKDSLLDADLQLSSADRDEQCREYLKLFGLFFDDYDRLKELLSHEDLEHFNTEWFDNRATDLNPLVTGD